MASHGQKKWLGNQEAFCGDYYIKHVIGLSPRSLGLVNSVEQSGTLAATDYKQPLAVIQTIGIGGMTANAAISKELYPTLLANHDRGYVIKTYGIQGNIIGRSINAGGNGIGFKENQAPTLTMMDRHWVLYCGTKNDHLRDLSIEIAPTLRTGGKGGGAINQAIFHFIPPNVFYLARYLTEIECERLQGFPDNYTNILKAASTHRYKALGIRDEVLQIDINGPITEETERIFKNVKFKMGLISQIVELNVKQSITLANIARSEALFWGFELEDLKDLSEVQARRTAVVSDAERKLQEAKEKMKEGKRLAFKRKIEMIEAGEVDDDGITVIDGTDVH